MYEIYETEAFILKSQNLAENNKRSLIFSKDFGLIWVESAGSRKEVSKFRPFLQDFSQKIENIELDENEIKRFVREINQQLKKIAF